MRTRRTKIHKDIPTGCKECLCCHRVERKEFFVKDSRNKDGRVSILSECWNKQNREKRKLNKAL